MRWVPYVPRRNRGRKLSRGLTLTDSLSTRTEPNLLLWRISTLAWAALMLYLSTARFGEGMSGWLLTRALAFVHLKLSPLAFAIVHIICRKLAHLTEYGIFSLLVYRSLSTLGSLGGRLQRAFLSVSAAAAYSLTDEFHQLFVVGRHGSVTDCAIDSVGAVLAMLVVFGCRRFLSNREEEEQGLA